MTPNAAVVLGFLLIAVGIPMIRNWIPRTALDQMLIPGLAMTEKVWSESHRRSGWDFVMLGLGLIGLAVWISRGGGAPTVVRDFLGMSVVIALLITGIRSVIVTVRLAREHDAIL